MAVDAIGHDNPQPNTIAWDVSAIVTHGAPQPYAKNRINTVHLTRLIKCVGKSTS